MITDKEAADFNRQEKGQIVAISMLQTLDHMIKAQDRWRIVLLNDADVSGPTGF